MSIRRRPWDGLSVAQQQLVEVARALALRPRILVMDEPTSALSTPEQAHLLSLVRDLRARGITILYITHRLDEVFAIADRITVLKDGRHMATVATASVTHNEIVRLMVGRDVAADLYPARRKRACRQRRARGAAFVVAGRACMTSLSKSGAAKSWDWRGWWDRVEHRLRARSSVRHRRPTAISRSLARPVRIRSPRTATRCRLGAADGGSQV